LRITFFLAKKCLAPPDLPGESNADLEGGDGAQEHKQRQIADAYHRRFLLSLKASYSSQFSHGVIDAAPFRILEWAVNKALLHMRDTEASKVTFVDPLYKPYEKCLVGLQEILMPQRRLAYLQLDRWISMQRIVDDDRWDVWSYIDDLKLSYHRFLSIDLSGGG
jgi:hypothetical protein